jgi:hypothetical protein
MKAIVNLDKRGDADKKFDDMWNKLCAKAKLTPIQSNLVANYLRELIGIRMHEIESAVDMAWLVALIESENFGTDVAKGATRLLRVQQYAADVRNEAYGKGCVNANGVWDKYDGCGVEHLKVRLSRYNVEYDTGI